MPMVRIGVSKFPVASIIQPVRAVTTVPARFAAVF
jgi:hypothetical protein